MNDASMHPFQLVAQRKFVVRPPEQPCANGGDMQGESLFRIVRVVSDQRCYLRQPVGDCPYGHVETTRGFGGDPAAV
jgi:hypothetical protein